MACDASPMAMFYQGIYIFVFLPKGIHVCLAQVLEMLLHLKTKSTRSLKASSVPASHCAAWLMLRPPTGEKKVCQSGFQTSEANLRLLAGVVRTYQLIGASLGNLRDLKVALRVPPTALNMSPDLDSKLVEIMILILNNPCGHQQQDIRQNLRQSC